MITEKMEIAEDLRAEYGHLFAAKPMERVKLTCGELFRLIERISRLEAERDQKDDWWLRLGKFRKALEQNDLHGHYTLFQEHFADIPEEVPKPARRAEDAREEKR